MQSNVESEVREAKVASFFPGHHGKAQDAMRAASDWIDQHPEVTLWSIQVNYAFMRDEWHVEVTFRE